MELWFSLKLSYDKRVTYMHGGGGIIDSIFFVIIL